MGEPENTPRAGRRFVTATAVTLVGVLALSAGLAALSLLTASGITQVGPTSYHTEFANPTWWYTGFLLAVPLFVASMRYPRFAVAFVVAALIPQVILPAVVVDRYASSRWGDGLEYFGYLIPILMVPFFAGVATFGALLGRSRRRPPTW